MQIGAKEAHLRRKVDKLVLEMVNFTRTNTVTVIANN